MSQILSLALIQTLLIYQPVISQTNLCIWGRQGYNSYINGQYTQSGSYYEKAAGPSCDPYYIYWKYDGWRIDYINGNSYYYAYCNSSSTLINCNEWYVWNDDYFEHDLEVTISTGECPTWNCDAITIPNAPNDCHSFNIPLGNNIWKNSANTRWWYFDPQYFAWYCKENYPTYSCDDLYWTWSEEETWIDLPKGQNKPITLLWPTTNTYTLNCIGPTISPANIPTVTPTDSTKTPTSIPTHTPTNMATITPTNIPTHTPTDSTITPTDSTITPTDSTITPTNMPTITPTDIPTVAPIDIPTVTPTDIPTVTPTDIPTVTPTVTPTINPIVHNTVVNPSTPTLAVTHKGDDSEGSVLDRYTTYVPMVSENMDVYGHTKDNSSFWTIIIVFLVFMLICIAILSAIFVYKYKQDKGSHSANVKNINAVYSINKQLSNVPKMKPIERVRTHSHYIDDDDNAKNEVVPHNHVDGNPNNDTHINNNISDDVPQIIDDDATSNNDRNSSELDKQLELHDNYSAFNMETPGNISNFPSEENMQVTVMDDNTQRVNGEVEGDQHIMSVKEWLESQVKLSQYYDTLILNGYDTLQIISAITEKSELEEIGINKIGHIKKIMKEIKKIKHLD